MAITKEEILMGRVKESELSSELKSNLEILLKKMNELRSKYGKPMKVTSGYRSKEDQIRIYKDKGITDVSKIPMKSKHLYCQAVDISDPNKDLQKWCKQNESVLKEIGLWMEDFSATPNWVHFQAVPYASWKEGKSLWFNP